MNWRNSTLGTRCRACLASAGSAVVLLAVPIAALGLLRDVPWPAIAGTRSEPATALPAYGEDLFSSRRATGPTPSPMAVARKSFPVPSPSEAVQSADPLVRRLRTPDLE